MPRYCQAGLPVALASGPVQAHVTLPTFRVGQGPPGPLGAKRPGRRPLLNLLDSIEMGILGILFINPLNDYQLEIMHRQHS
jgi:hypothetical protein